MITRKSPLVSLLELGHQPHLTMAIPNIIIRGLAVLAVLDEAYVMLSQVKPQSPIKLDDTTYYPKNVG